MTRLSKRSGFAAILIGGALAAVGGGIIHAHADSSPTQLNAPVVVRDASGAEALSVQLQLGVRNTGAFDFSVGGVGDWVGVIPVAPVSSQISRLKGTATAAFEATGATTTTPASVTMEGEIDQSHNSATVNVWVTLPSQTSQTHYLLQTGNPATGQAPGVAQQALAALQADDWAAIYGLADSNVTSQYSAAQFSQAMGSQQQPAMADAAFAGPGAATVLSGVTYFDQPITFSAVGSGGTSTTYTATLILVWQQGQWRFSGTSEPQASS